MRESEQYVEIAKQLFVVIIFFVACYWYVGQEEEPENISVFLLCVYFMAVLVICKFGWYLQYCCRSCLPKTSFRERARIFMYTTNTKVLRGVLPATIGESVDLFIVLISLFSCLMYVAETYFPFLIEEMSWQVVEFVLSLVFLVDYIMRITLAVDMLQYAFSSVGIVNVVTVLPVLVYSCDRIFKEATGKLNPSVGSGTKLTYLRLLRLAKLLRILRSMNILKSSSSENVRRELAGLVFTVSALIFSAAGVYQWLENDDSCFNVRFENTLSVSDYSDPGVYAENGCVYFHEALYWCTIEVLGRPRMIMQSHTTILMLICLVTLSVLLIPRHINAVFQALQATNPYQRQIYKRSGRGTRHLVLVGHKEFASINMLLYELFHPDRGDHRIHDVVLLFPVPPDRDLLALLSHPAYIGRVTYLQGSPLNEKDLVRASIATAHGVIVIANKDSDSPQWHDGELLTCIQSMKAFWLRDAVHEHGNKGGHFSSSHDAKKYLRPCIVTQVLLPETKESLRELPGWTDRDVVVVCSEYVAWMTAMASMARGMATVAFNLTSHTEKQRFYRTKWYPRYEGGANQEIYSRKVKSGGGLDRCDVIKASEILAKKRVLLIAFERKRGISESGDEEDDSFDGVHLFPGPPNFILRAQDHLFCIAQSNPALQRAFASVGEGAIKAIESRPTIRVPITHRPSRVSRFSSRSIGDAAKRLWGNSQRSNAWMSTLTDNDSDNERLQAEIVLESHSSDEFVHICSAATDRTKVPRGCEDVRHNTSLRNSFDSRGMSSFGSLGSSSTPEVELFRNPTTQSMRFDTAPTTPTHSMGFKARKQLRATLVEKLSAYDPPWSRHIVICGLPQTQIGRDGGRGLVTCLIETILESNNVGPHPLELTKVCIIDIDAINRVADLCLVELPLADVVHEGRLRAVSADPRKREALEKDARVHSALTVVALPEHVTQARTKHMSIVEMKDGENRPKMMKQIIDTNTVLTMQVAQNCARKARKAQGLDMDKPSLKRQSTDSPSSSKTSELHSVTLLLQESTNNLYFGQANMRHSGAAVHDPRWMDISPLNMSPLFASGELLAMTCLDRFVVEALFTPQIVQLTNMFLFGDRQGHHLYQTYCPDDFVKQPYTNLVDHLRSEGQLPIAVMRSPNKFGQTFVEGEATQHEGLPDASLPYVVTNPDPDTIILQRSDLVFIIGSRRASDLITRQDSKQSSGFIGLSPSTNSSRFVGETISFPVGQRHARRIKSTEGESDDDAQWEEVEENLPSAKGDTASFTLGQKHARRVSIKKGETDHDEHSRKEEEEEWEKVDRIFPSTKGAGSRRVVLL